MEIFKSIDEHEELIFVNDKSSGLRGIIGIHNTSLGVALGGTRVWPYASENEAIIDVLRLSRGMTYKSALAGLNLGGAKAVIIADPKEKSEAMFRAFGRFIEGLNGRYITAEDVNTNVHDMDYINMETNYVTGTSSLSGSGNPSPFTAYGVFLSMKAAVEYKFGKKTMKDIHVAIQGIGNVSYSLCRFLHHEGARITVCDLSQEKCEKVKTHCKAEIVSIDDIYDVPCDIFSPNALGASINDSTINRIKAKIIVGAANNQLAEPKHGDILHEKGVLYAPDYLVNAGGIINVYHEIFGYSSQLARNHVSKIYNVLQKLFIDSETEHIATYKMADLSAERRIAAVNSTKRVFIHSDKQSIAYRINNQRPIADIQDTIFDDLM